MFVGNLYAARCLGPINLGISAQILAFSQQASLIYNGGFDTIAVREIASDRRCAPALAKSIVIFRLALAVPILSLWFLSAFLILDDPILRTAWLLGGTLVVLGSLSIGFVFQGLERLPIQAAAGLATSVLTAGAFFIYFHPGIPLGSDLVVAVIATTLSLAGLWGYYVFHCGANEGGTTSLSTVFANIRQLLRSSWYYWALAVTVFMYSGIQIPIVTYFLGERNAGIYRSAFLFATGLYLVFNSINSLLLPRLVRWREQGQRTMWRRQVKLAMVLSLIGAPTVFIAIVAAPLFYRLFLGPEFADGVPVFQILSIQMLIVFVGQIFTSGLTANGQHAACLRASLIGAVICIGANPIVAPSFGLIGVALVSVASDIAIHGYGFLAGRRHFKRQTT
jgi:O-antigen/teichoic acid export membrane protein